MLLAQPLDKAVGKEAQLCQQFSLPTAWAKAVAKPARTSEFCQQPEPKLLGKLARLVGKAQLCQQLWPMLLAKLGFFPLYFCCFLAFNPHISI
jgi:hypothetical protein